MDNIVKPCLLSHARWRVLTALGQDTRGHSMISHLTEHVLQSLAVTAHQSVVKTRGLLGHSATIFKIFVKWSHIFYGSANWLVEEILLNFMPEKPRVGGQLTFSMLEVTVMTQTCENKLSSHSDGTEYPLVIAVHLRR